jgi:hypothetical protein
MKRNFLVMVAGIAATMMVAGSTARAQVVYRWDNGIFQERFNNSEGSETEDNWVANAFVVVDGGNRLLSIDWPMGETYSAQAVTVAVYQGVDISDPSAGGGLVLLQTNDATVTGAQFSVANIPIDPPVDMNVGDVFYAAFLIRQVPSAPTCCYPFLNQTDAPAGHSFFDVGPAQGADYDITMTQNATVNGGIHPVVDSGVQSAGNTHLRVNATATP